MKNKEFDIPFSGLKLGKHHFEYQIDRSFFESFGYEDFHAARIGVQAELEKMSNMMELHLSAAGTVNVNCDVTDEPFDLPVAGSLDLVIKFGEAYNNEDDEILVLPHGEHQMNIAQYVYEMLVLAVPSKRVHPGIEDGTLDSEILKKLEELQPRQQKHEDERPDPRWDALRNLLTDKK